ncbi:MAG: hypothetical protein COW85_01265 [Ignavibacteria bacterium CG22_combo_CG10-13_8_21_14_all_37_15]|nr:MAG: hypothetical protein COW85_01265 [Ignavibacteria bacterium CG22_combo_CG10-13_8_21_14_all_37_15]
MPKLPQLTFDQAESLLLDSGFKLMRTKGSHKIYFKEKLRIVLPFHSGKILHPKIIRQVFKAIEE